MSPGKAPQDPPQFPTETTSIIEDVNHHIDQARGAIDKIVASVTPETAIFANVLLPLAHIQNELDRSTRIYKEFQDVSPDRKLREASRETTKLLIDFRFERASRRDIFRLVDSVAKKNQDLDGESKTFLDMELRNYRRGGLNLPYQERQRLKEIHQRKNTLHDEFWDVQDSRDNCIYFHPEELDGISAEVLSGLEKGKGEFIGMLKATYGYATSCAVMEYASIEDTRRRYLEGWPEMPKRKEEIFRKIMLLRDEAARLLGYPNHAAFMIEDRVAKDPAAVNDFLYSLRDGLCALGSNKVKALRKLKQLEHGSRGEGCDGRFYSWDRRYYGRIFSEMEQSVEEDSIAEYFPLQETTHGMLHIFETLFGLVFEKIEKPIVWQDDVQALRVWDSENLGGGFLGYLYLDLYKRENKYDGICSVNLQPVCPREYLP
jgi:metallopeptidase MepB